MKYTTLEKIIKHEPCYSDNDMDSLIDKYGLTTEISFKQILDKVGILDAVWCLRTLEYREECLFRADISKLFIPEFEKRYPADDWPRKTIVAVRTFSNGEMSEKELRDADHASAAYAHAAYADASAAYAHAAYADAAYADASAADAHAHAHAHAAYDHAAYVYADAYAAFRKQIKALFIKHFCKVK